MAYNKFNAGDVLVLKSKFENLGWYPKFKKCQIVSVILNKGYMENGVMIYGLDNDYYSIKSYYDLHNLGEWIDMASVHQCFE